MEQQVQVNNQKQCVKRREVSVAGDEDNKLLQQLPWPTKRPCSRKLDNSGDFDTIQSVKGYCLSKNMPTDMYRPVAGQCGGSPGKFRLADLIGELHRVFAEDHVNVEYVQYLMESYHSDPAEWLKYAKFNKFRYTRNLVDAGNGKFNLMVLCWGEGNGSSIHNHPDSDCLMKVLAGQLTEVRFAWPSAPNTLDEQNGDNDEDLRPMHETGRALLEMDSVCHINDTMGLHRVENASHTDKAVSLHLYCPPFEECTTFNQHTGHKTKAKSTFWSIHGEKVSKKLKIVEDMPDDN